MKKSNVYKINPSVPYEKPKVETVVMDKAIADRLLKQEALKSGFLVIPTIRIFCH